MIDCKTKKLEHLNVQQVGKNELKKTLKDNTYKIALNQQNPVKEKKIYYQKRC